MISFGRLICNRIADAVDREWIETNGRGSYAMGTVAGVNTRRYHGLLTIHLPAQNIRYQVINRLEESLLVDQQRIEISSQTYPGVVYPQGYLHLESFRLDPYPIWTYAFSNIRLEKIFFLRYGEDTAVIIYRQLSGPSITLEVRPLLSCRNHHHLMRESNRFADKVDVIPSGLRIKNPDAPDIFVNAQNSQFSAEGFWYKNQQYGWEQKRGLDFREDAYSPGIFRFSLSAGQSVSLTVSPETRPSAEALPWAQQEKNLRLQCIARSKVRGPLADTLALAADQFLVERNGQSGIMAGYPWFEEWGRDAMISLPGLCLATGRHEEAAKILSAFSRYHQNGLLPNYIPETSTTPNYDAVDVSLWFVGAVQSYLKATNDLELVKTLSPVLHQIMDSYQHGKISGITMEEDGLLSASRPNTALTWMDARVANRPVTPRAGKPVELQALWYNALQFMAELDMKLQAPSNGYDKLASIARTSFNEKFWNEASGYLFDRIDGKERDGSIRPNALLCVSLPYEILDSNRFKAIVDKAWQDLYTTYGLRTLSPSDPAYRAQYGTTPEERDSAYHQGTVWPWLIGPFITAYVKAYGSSDPTKSQIQAFLQPFGTHLTEGGLESVSEIADGNAPHALQGCPAQAWSVAEILRVLWEENISL
ncbi:MAG TPA: amylo-alpha-1,6-glucosidase [Elusimicrobiota bacterium]|nr:amylo-alpha-1,6-glucosidase [Elusimicrobiota bacterium]